MILSRKTNKVLDDIKQGNREEFISLDIRNERNLYYTSHSIDQSKDNKDEGEENEDDGERLAYIDNKKLNTPYFRLISNIKDGSNALKKEIYRSISRVKAARHGHSIDRIFEDHDYSFYLPKKESYISKKKAKLMRLESETSSVSRRSKGRSRVFQTELPDNNYASSRSTEARKRRSNTTLRLYKLRNSSYDNDPMKFREIKEKYTNEMKTLPTENNTIDFIVSENKSYSRDNHTAINNILDYKATRPSIDDNEVRMVSYINSKPVQPYISLLPLKNFLKKEQEFARKGTLGQSSNDKSKGKNGKTQDVHSGLNFKFR